MVLETLLSQIGATPIEALLIAIVGYFIVRELNAFNDMKTTVHKYDSDFNVLKRDFDELKKQLEKLESEHGKLHPRKGGK